MSNETLIRALKAYRDGDFSVRLDAASGVDPELVAVFNEITEKSKSFKSEIERVTHEVGVEGRLGQRFTLPNLSGDWQNMADNVSSMTANLDQQFRAISTVTHTVARGDLSHKISVPAKGEVKDLIDLINGMVDELNLFASELHQTTRELGTQGKFGRQMNIPHATGTWSDMRNGVNLMSQQIAEQFVLISNTTSEVARGNLSVSIDTQNLNGDVLALANVINTMTNHLKLFTDRLSLVALEIGSKGKLGGYIKLRGTEGVWKDLIDHFNVLARNTTSQIRALSDVTGAIAKGDLTKIINLDLQGESLELKNIVNCMVAQLTLLTSEVTRVTREVGVDGILGAQISMPGLQGVWEVLVAGLNTMVANLTSQIRAISEVVTAFLQGDFTRNIPTTGDSTNGDIASLRNSINQLALVLKDYALHKDGENDNSGFSVNNSRKRTKVDN